MVLGQTPNTKRVRRILRWHVMEHSREEKLEYVGFAVELNNNTNVMQAMFVFDRKVDIVSSIAR